LLHPLIVFATCLLWRQSDDRFGPESLVLVLIAALPSASNVQMLAERYRANIEPIALIIFYSTALAFFSFMFLAWGLQH
jgi:hypothetical protein